MKKRTIGLMQIYFVTLFFLAFGTLYAEEAIKSQTEIAELGITQLTLKNGMRVCLKRIPESDEEIFIQLFAVGGLAAFPEDALVSGLLAPDIAIESGIGTLHSADMTRLLFEEWFDFSVKIQPYQRIIETGCFAESLQHVLGLIHLLYTEAHFTESGLQRVIEQMKDSISHRQQDCEVIFEDSYLAINTKQLKILQPLTVEDLKKIDLKTAKTVFHRSFSVPSEFVCVIAGDFTVSKVIPLIVEHLASIPSSETIPPPLVDQGLGIDFPKGISSHEVICGNEEENNTRITFPLKIDPKEKKFHELEFVTQIIETRLRNTIRDKVGTTQGIDVGYEFPQYPHLNEVWLTVQYRSERSITKSLTNLILFEMTKLRIYGPTLHEIADVKLLMQRMDKFWAEDTSYWIATLSNYYKWGWDLSDIFQSRKQFEEIGSEQILPFFKKGFSMEQYTIITRQRPEK